MKQEIDMLHGPLFGKTIAFAIPLAVTGVLQQLFNAFDTAVMGQFVGKEAMAAVGSNAPVIGLVVAFFIGISLGANVRIAQFVGAKRADCIPSAVATAIALSLGGGLAMTLAGELAAEPLLQLLAVPEELLPLSLLYLRLFIIGFPTILLYNFLAAIFRSQGDTRTPLFALIASGIVKMGLTVLFVIGLDMSVAGVALSTLLASVVSSGILLVYILRTTLPIRLSFHNFHPALSILKDILAIGIPAGMQGAVFSLSNIIIQSAINSLGTDIMAASAIGFNLDILPYFVVNAFGQACTTFTGQNYGGRQYDRCRKILKITTLQSYLCAYSFGALILSFDRPLTALFHGDELVYSYVHIRLMMIMLAEGLNILIEQFSGSMRGCGQSLIPALIAIFGICGTRILWVYTIFDAHPDFTVLMAVYPVSWAVTALVIVSGFFSIRKQLFP